VTRDFLDDISKDKRQEEDQLLLFVGIEHLYDRLCVFLRKDEVVVSSTRPDCGQEQDSNPSCVQGPRQEARCRPQERQRSKDSVDHQICCCVCTVALETCVLPKDLIKLVLSEQIIKDRGHASLRASDTVGQQPHTVQQKPHGIELHAVVEDLPFAPSVHLRRGRKASGPSFRQLIVVPRDGPQNKRRCDVNKERRNLFDGVKDKAVAQKETSPAQWAQPTGVKGDESTATHAFRNDVEEEEREVEARTYVCHPTEIQQKKSSVVHLYHLKPPGGNENETLDGVNDPEVLGVFCKDKDGEDEVHQS